MVFLEGNRKGRSAQPERFKECHHVASHLGTDEIVDAAAVSNSKSADNVALRSIPRLLRQGGKVRAALVQISTCPTTVFPHSVTMVQLDAPWVLGETRMRNAQVSTKPLIGFCGSMDAK